MASYLGGIPLPRMMPSSSLLKKAFEARKTQCLTVPAIAPARKIQVRLHSDSFPSFVSPAMKFFSKLLAADIKSEEPIC
jgi:hypothetical protein